jgi:hypothetical protein
MGWRMFTLYSAFCLRKNSMAKVSGPRTQWQITVIDSELHRT